MRTVRDWVGGEIITLAPVDVSILIFYWRLMYVNENKIDKEGMSQDEGRG